MANTLNSNKRNSISVCMATYNGEKYIEKQLDSILKNLTNEDELIISDDGSTDNTIDILNKYAKKYKQIVLLEGPRKGVIKNFEYALKYAKKDIIFLSDQDDEWEQDKVEKVIREFNKERIYNNTTTNTTTNNNTNVNSGASSNKVNTTTTSKTYIGEAKAKSIMLSKVPGATIRSFHFDGDSTPEYEAELVKDGYEYDISVNALTGAIREFSKERIEAYDDDRYDYDDDDRYDD